MDIEIYQIFTQLVRLISIYLYTLTCINLLIKFSRVYIHKTSATQP